MVGGGVAWALLTGLYLVFAGQVSVSEVVAGVLAGLAAALLSVAVRSKAKRRFRFHGVPWLLLLGRPALVLVTDTARAGGALARAVLHGPEVHGAPEGATVRQAFARGGDDAQDAARRGLVTLGVSLTPNSYVLRILDERDEMRLHRLAEREPSANQAWPL
jgi:multisubunit Na+/H+ antiporter MnhE subunit